MKLAALVTIRERKLYRRTHRRFEDYVKDRWSISYKHAWREIKAWNTCKSLQSSTFMPKSESHVRFLYKLPEEQQPLAWQAAIELAEGKQPDKRHIMQAVNRFRTPERLDPNFGEPLDFPDLRCAPVNELGVVFLFGALSKRLGFQVEAVHAGFPDCYAKRLTDPKLGRYKNVKIEFEYSSRNFHNHHHHSEHCDLIVCWIHDWQECPIEVIALKDVLARLNDES